MIESKKSENEIWDLIHNYLDNIYDPETSKSTHQKLRFLISKWPSKAGLPRRKFHQKDCLLISYADHIFDEKGETHPLHHLYEFFHEELNNYFSGIHLLPFFPSSSDAGFAVKDYREVNPSFGDWGDIQEFNCDLMFDAVFNHTSSSHEWFQKFLLGEAPYKDYYISYPQKDIITENFQKNVQLVTRPRPTPLFNRYRSNHGDIFLWTTFSKDQVDLNYKSPDLLLAIMETLLFYVEQGANFLRIDAIPYLWKELGTNCLHLDQTHTVVKLFRAVLDLVSPDTSIITESNVPHEENISYFGEGHDEAQVVYNFSLAPLILHTVIAESSQNISQWNKNINLNFNSNTFLNFTSSHDGIGVRPLEGIVSNEAIDHLCEVTLEKGGKISQRSTPEGERPYELNITWANLLYNTDQDRHTNVNKYMLTHAMCISFPGIPAIYFHNMFAAFNYETGYNLTKHRRDLNRRKYSTKKLHQMLEVDGFHKDVFVGMKKLLLTRRKLQCLCPTSTVVQFENPKEIWAIGRHHKASNTKGLFIYNVSSETINFPLSKDIQNFMEGETFYQLFNQTNSLDEESLQLNPYEYLWFTTEKL